MMEYRDEVGFICNLCTSFLNLMVYIFLRCADPETYNYYYFNDQPTQYNYPDCLYHEKLSYFHLRWKNRTTGKNKKKKRKTQNIKYQNEINNTEHNDKNVDSKIIHHNSTALPPKSIKRWFSFLVIAWSKKLMVFI